MGQSSSSSAPQARKYPFEIPDKFFTRSEVAQHNKDTDCWIIVDKLVFNVTRFVNEHPGGRNILLDVAGKDSSMEFDDAHHSEAAVMQMKEFVIGKVAESAASDSKSAAVPAQTGQDSTSGQSQGPSASGASTSSSAAPSNPAPAASSSSPANTQTQTATGPRMLFLFGSQTGHSEKLAKRLAESCAALVVPGGVINTTVCSMKDFDPEDLSQHTHVVMFVSTYTEGKPPQSAAYFFQWLSEAVVDWRVEKGWLKNMRYAVFGSGNSLYDEHFNTAGRTLDGLMKQLKAKPIVPLGEADDSVSRKDDKSAEYDYTQWTKAFLAALPASFAPAERTAAAPPSENPEQYDVVDDEEETAEDGKSDKEKLVDVEDMGSVMAKKKAPKPKKPQRPALQPDEKQDGCNSDDEGEEAQDVENAAAVPVRPMLTDQLRKSLTKQGYRLLGDHSGVKLCRWTKAMLRGRGGCYKHTFYGIKSYQCMEMTPSLACANKCVFCWRHHSNPVGREWRWTVDDPKFLVDSAIENHRKMVKEMKGVPGVKPERFEEASTIRHCALSLVGEPIMYPHINEYVRLLHERNISSFLVTNAQFPDRIREMEPVTQLYVSIDAGTQESLKAIDRPLFKDFWERYLGSLAALKDKRQRTVYRMTLVKEFNMKDIAEYAKLVNIGRPTFIEIKGVTFCGRSDASSLTMQNVPFHIEVRNFAQKLLECLGDPTYEIACEHVHSCCILISNTELKVNGKWHTWIDYERFTQVVTEYYATGKPFSTVDYMAPTPDWAVFGAVEAGFDPEETRFYRKGKGDAPEAE